MMSEGDSIVLENVKVDNHGKLSGKVRHTGGEESTAFSRLFERIQNHFNNEQIVSTTPHNVHSGELYIGRCSKDKKWHRVRVENVLATGQGYQASCFLLDVGIVDLIPLQFLRHIPETYLEVPFQLKKLYLYGIAPITLRISPEDLMVSTQTSYRWDSSAVNFIMKNIEMSRAFNAVVIEQKSDDSLGIRLYLTIGRKQFCLNEQLVMLGYATLFEESDEDIIVPPVAPVKQRRTIEDVLKSKKINLKPSAKIGSEDRVYASEPELKCGLSHASSGSDQERGYATDFLSQTIPHRHRQISSNSNVQNSHSGTVAKDRDLVKCSSDSGERNNLSQDKLGSINIKDNLTCQKGILAKLEAKLKAASGRSSPVSDIDPQENILVRPKQRSWRSSQSSVGRLQISSTTVTSFHQTESESETSDFSTGAQSKLAEFQTASQIFPKTASQSFSETKENSNSDFGHFLKGYQSDTSHVHMKSNSAVGQPLSPHMCNDTESKRLFQYDEPLLKPDRQKLSVSERKQAESPQGVKQEHKTSPFSSLIKQLSESNSSLSSCASVGRGRGRGIIVSYSPEPVSPHDSVRTGICVQDEASKRNIHSLKSDRSTESDKLNSASSLRSPVLSVNCADNSDRESSIGTGFSQKNHDESSNTYSLTSPLSAPNYLNIPRSQKQVERSVPFTESSKPRSVFEDSSVFSSDSETPFQSQKKFYGQKSTVYSSGTEFDTTNILAKSLTGQAVFTKSRLPNEVAQNFRKSPKKSPGKKLPQIVQQVSSLPTSKLEMKGDEGKAKEFETDLELITPLSRLGITEAGDTAGAERMAAQKQKMLENFTRLSITEAGDAAERTDEQKQKMLAKFTGERMLKNLKENSVRHRTNPQEKQEKIRSKGMFGVEDNVLVHGIQPKRPLYRFSEARFAETVAQHWMQMDYPSPQIVQAYSWPAIRQGKHVIAIAPQKSGKTLAYLCPLITSLTDRRVYQEVGAGNGPYLLILTSSWRKADAVYTETMHLLGGRSDLKLILLHGGGKEENRGCQLINGCEILVVTPPTLKRVIDAGYTDLQRLCHLVIDDAEEIMENFGEELIFLMRQYTDVISNQRASVEAPRQILAFGSQWTGRMHSFMNTYPVEPQLIITSAFEASIYGRVKQITHMCKENERIREITGLFDNTKEDTRTIVFAAKKEDIVKLYNILRNYCHYCLMVHQDMEMYEISQVVEEWRQHKLPILVCCDDHISEMKISDASTIINYDLPVSKTRFCNRLACLRKYFWDFSSEEEPKIQPISHLIISEDCGGSQLYHIYQLLKRSNSPIPQQFKAMTAGVKRGREEDDDKELCSQLLAFGFCRNQWKCEFRHLVFSELDHGEEFDWIPDEGEVQVYITSVKDASHYYVRLISVRHGDAKEDLGMVYAKLQLDMGQWYGNLSNRAKHKSLYIGEICGFQDKENFYRVQILNIKDMNCKGATNIDVTVKLVDSGLVEDIPAHKLYELPTHLKEVPFQAVEVFVCRVKPMDRDVEWTNQADLFICGLLDDKVVEGKIVLRLGNILWLDPLVERHNLGETKTVINKAYVHRELVNNGFADENPNHLEKLYKLCEGRVKIPKALIKKAKLDSKLETDVLPECKQYHNVVVSSVARPNLFFVQRKEKLDELEDLMDTISTMMSSQDPVEDVGIEVKVGDYCLAQYTSFDKRWYRGRVTKLDDDTCEVFFADYGDRDTVPRDKVRKVPNDDKLTDFPLQGIECKLVDIEPRGSLWDEKVGDVMWDLAHFVNGDMKTFTATVKSKEKPDFAGRSRFIVDLSDSSRAQDFNMAQELVWQGLGGPEENSNVTELFDVPSRAARLKLLITNNSLQDTPDLCAVLYWEQNETTALKIAGDLNSKLSRILSTRLIQEEEASVMKALISSVVKLVGRVSWPDVNRVILNTVLVISRGGERLCEYLLGEDCDQQIIRCLELNSSQEVQSDAADIVGKLVQASSSWRSCFEDFKHLEVLYDLFDSTESQQIQGLVCRAFSVLCSNSGVFTDLMDRKICSRLAKLLTRSADHETIETVILFLLALSHQNSGHPELEKESLLQAVIESLKKSNCGKCIHYCVQFCANFGSQKRKHKTVLLELEMVPCLSRVLQADLSPETKQLCKDLIHSLAIKVPSQKMSGVRARKEDVAAESIVPPAIHWAQNSFNVMLSVKVKGVTNSSELVKIQDDIVKFRTVVDGVCFAFTYKLFDTVMSDHSRIRVKTSEVQISMKKVEQGKWPRLLHQKQKPANLSIDFERFVDSSDSDFCDEDEPFLLKRKKKAKAFSGEGAPKKKGRVGEPAEDSETDTSDSLENAEDPDVLNRDRFNFFD